MSTFMFLDIKICKCTRVYFVIPTYVFCINIKLETKRISLLENAILVRVNIRNSVYVCVCVCVWFCFILKYARKGIDA